MLIQKVHSSYAAIHQDRRRQAQSVYFKRSLARVIGFYEQQHRADILLWHEGDYDESEVARIVGEITRRDNPEEIDAKPRKGDNATHVPPPRATPPPAACSGPRPPDRGR